MLAVYNLMLAKGNWKTDVFFPFQMDRIKEKDRKFKKQRKKEYTRAFGRKSRIIRLDEKTKVRKGQK